MRDNEYFGYKNDEAYFDDTARTDTHTNEMARNAVERFLEAETSDYMAGGYGTKRAERPDRTELPTRAAGPVTAELDDDTWCPPAPPDFTDDEEFMAQLANIRRERPRRDANPTPKPAVRVNTERRRRTTSPVELHETDADWAPLADKDVDAFRMRYSEDDIMSAPKEAKVKDPHARGAMPVHRRDSDRPVGSEGASPLRYLLAIMFVGVLILMAFLALNNRNLRRDLDTYQAQVARMDDNAITVESQRLEIIALNASLAEYRANASGPGPANEPPDTTYEPSNEYDDPYYEEPPNRPSSDETPPYEPQPTPVPQPQQIIHVVQAGQFLSHIARDHFGIGSQHYIDLILAANPNITNPNNIREGQEIIIPPRE